MPLPQMYRSAAGSDYFKLAQPGEKALHIGKRILEVYLILGGKRVGKLGGVLGVGQSVPQKFARFIERYKPLELERGIPDRYKYNIVNDLSF